MSELNPLIKQIDKFSSAYEGFFKQPNATTALKLLMSARVLSQSLYVTSNLLSGLKEAVEPKREISEDNQELSLLLPLVTDYNDYLTKLTAIGVIYSELCFLMEVSTSKYPLQVIKIESGSLWLKVFGESKVIRLLTSLIESTVLYMYRNYTNEGKLYHLPRKVESIEAVLQLSEKLKEAGIDTTDLKDNLQKSSVIISSQLNNLLLGEPSIEINGEIHSIQQTLQEKYLQDSRKLLLEEGHSEGETLSS